MADETRYGAGPADATEVGEVGELDLDVEGPDLESAMRDAVAAVEGVEGAAHAEEHLTRVAPAVSESDSERLRREADELRDRLMRTLADFDNLRKRTERERHEIRRFALFDAMREFLAVVDNLERAVAAGGSRDDVRAGVEMILRQMQELLTRHGVTAVEALGRPFDPTLHEAVAREEGAAVAEPTVVDELQRGYRMHDRLLRPAMVRVAMPSEGGTGGGGGHAS
jgi:molecular chaperone GrpE